MDIPSREPSRYREFPKAGNSPLLADNNPGYGSEIPVTHGKSGGAGRGVFLSNPLTVLCPQSDSGPGSIANRLRTPCSTSAAISR